MKDEFWLAASFGWPSQGKDDIFFGMFFYQHLKLMQVAYGTGKGGVGWRVSLTPPPTPFPHTPPKVLLSVY